VIAFTMLTLFMTGIAQLTLGRRPHRPHRQVPALPVLAGFINGAAVLILLSALRPMIGMPAARTPLMAS
jgi:MFS superfamily sulfate permease-like transporter